VTRRIYIAGPMTGIPDFNYPAFHAAAADLRAAGYYVQNPAENGGPEDHPGWVWDDWIREGVRQLLMCDAVALLPGWHNSRGAAIERRLADALAYDVRPVSEWVPR
jgi:hypothetical protein